MKLTRVGLCCLLALFSACSSETSTLTPQANAGDDQDALIGETTTLNGLGSVGALSIVWTLQSKPSGSTATIAQANSLQATFVPDVVGEYVAKLSLNDGASTDQVTITAQDAVAVITPSTNINTRTRFNTTEYVINLSDAGVLSGASSRAATGTSIASYQWEQISGPSSTTTNGSTNATLEFTAPALSGLLTTSDRYKWQALPVSREDTKMVFLLTVTSNTGSTSTETFTVYVQDGGAEIATSSGLPNVGVGTTVYMSGPNIKAATASTAVTDWTWTMTAPSGSSAKFVDTGTTSSALEFPKFVPDVAGLYTLAYSSTSGAVSGSIQVNAAEWVGVGTIGGTTATTPQCGSCHDGSPEADRMTSWGQTAHASLFENAMNTYAGLAPTPYLWQFHTVGYDTNASNDGFDDLASTNAFEFPDTGMSYATFTSEHASVAALANVQCENCHGPGSQHSGDPLRIKYSASQYGVCGQCHLQEAEWVNSGHNSTGNAHGAAGYQNTWLTNTGCVRCHTADGYKNHVAGNAEAAVTETGKFVGITCAACHDPHNATNTAQLRLQGNITMVADGTTVNAGTAAVCYDCHDGFYESGEDDCDANSDGIPDRVCASIEMAADEYFRQVHYNPQAPVLEGKGALADLDNDDVDDLTLDENSFHSDADFILASVTGNTALSTTNNKCVTCHMAAGPAENEEAYRHLGGHAFKLRTEHGLGHLLGEETEDDESAEAGDVQLLSSCTVCHSSVTDFNRTARADYDGDGSQEGIQDEVQGLLVALTTKILSVDGSTNVKDGTTSSSGTITVNTLGYKGSCSSFTATGCAASAGTTSCNNVATGKTRNDYQICNFLDTTLPVRRAIWNHNMIVRDGSFGIHNAAYTIQVLQQTYTEVGGNSFATDYPSATRR